MDMQSPDRIAQPQERDVAAASDDVAVPAADGPGEVGELVAVAKPLGSRAPEFVKSSRPLHLGWQVGVFLVGLLVVVTGVILLPLPGPGWLVIFAGMAIWGTEFVWAQLVLRWTKRKVAEAARRALDPKVRRRNIALTSVGGVICAVLLSVYLWKFGIAMPWSIED
ncbi:TIGR02611 family protein [Streptomyces johnsoniae]|uniref:TIGR02611 family protein n=1 Tax=Streptomyces johnsoniae TaxID=3075532 RepID=A0ABU2S5E6_9ACTN|nr:TIGR02611 family protein [Streptomyces sp. DSM 41886]MDT0443054.1 TIGR02611 family protein [Streptomyces sp. DSM 41886]